MPTKSKHEKRIEERIEAMRLHLNDKTAELRRLEMQRESLISALGVLESLLDKSTGEGVTHAASESR